MSDFSKLKVAVIGGCQVSGMMSALKALLVGATVKAWHVGVSLPAEEIAKELPGYDVIVTQGLDLSGWGDIEISKLRDKYEATKTVVFVPTVIFMGLQPDAAAALYNSELLKPDTGTVNSLIIQAAYSMGMTVEKTISLFSAEMFEHLGYLNSFPAAIEKLDEQFGFYGYDIKPHVPRWLKAGAFMHLPNHPGISMLSSMATMAAIKADLIPADTAPPSELPDYLATRECFPIYPAIAERLGFTGSLVWTLAHNRRTPDDSGEWELAKVVRSHFDTYASLPGLNLMTPRVKAVAAKIH